MPKVSPAHRESRRREILDAAARCFADRGFQRTSIADIIAESGLSAGAIYGHFASKQEIMIAVAERVVGHRVEELAAFASGEVPTPGEILRTLVAGMRRELPDARLLLHIWGEAVVDPEVQAVAARVFPLLHEAGHRTLTARFRSRGAAPAAAAERADELVPLMLGIVQGYVVQSALVPGFDAEAYLAAAARHLAD